MHASLYIYFCKMLEKKVGIMYNNNVSHVVSEGIYASICPMQKTKCMTLRREVLPAVKNSIFCYAEK